MESDGVQSNFKWLILDWVTVIKLLQSFLMTLSAKAQSFCIMAVITVVL